MAKYEQEQINYLQEDYEEKQEVTHAPDKHPELDGYINKLKAEIAEEGAWIPSLFANIVLSGLLCLVAIISAFIEALNVEFATVAFPNFLAITLLAASAITFLIIATYFVFKTAQIRERQRKLVQDLKAAQDSKIGL